MEVLAVIPARGGSKGIPRKNVLPLAGKPLIAYNIEQARQSRLVNRLVVSTDDAEIAGVARQYGADVVWRPPEISGDQASSESALLHTLEHLDHSEGYHPDLLVFLQCTSPLTLAEDIDGTVQALLDQQSDTALAVIPFHYFLWKPVAGLPEAESRDALGINHNKLVRPLRQQREPQYLETGAVYVMKVPGFLTARHRFFGRTALYEMPAERRLEIDDPVDFVVAESLLQHNRPAAPAQSRAGAPVGAILPDPVHALVLDFDGVFTDNKVITMQDGNEAVVTDRSDGAAIARLRDSGLPILILSSEANPVVQKRAAKLGLPCLNGVADKRQALETWLAERQIDPSQVVYVGNDLNDQACLKWVGCGVVVADAQPEVLLLARLVLQHAGGRGAVREICNLILRNLNDRS